MTESRKLLYLINELDVDLCLDLKIGGDGDPGEILIDFIDELIKSGRITIIIND